jgi:hypothetical protein
VGQKNEVVWKSIVIRIYISTMTKNVLLVSIKRKNGKAKRGGRM